MVVLHRSAVAALALLATSTALASDPSPWSATHGAAIRLLPGAQGEGGAWRAGIEIRLDPGWKTYWRTPGDSGLPPVFDWSRSANVADVVVLWPAPERFADGAGESVGYVGDVVLPLKVVPRDTKKPVELSLSIQYGACKDICVPARGEATLALDASSPIAPSALSLLEEAERSVPRRRELGAEGPLSVLEVVPDLARKPPSLAVDVRAGPDAILLVEGAADWYLPQPQPEGSAAGGTRRFTLALEGLPKSAKLAGVELRLTLVGAAGAVETTYTLP
jgi:DsbC/DsbD-like thiol-disulfide interchange protein